MSLLALGIVRKLYSGSTVVRMGAACAHYRAADDTSHSMKIVIETTRLILREFVPADAGALAAVLSDPETMRFYPEPLDHAGVDDWIARNIRRYHADRY